MSCEMQVLAKVNQAIKTFFIHASKLQLQKLSTEDLCHIPKMYIQLHFPTKIYEIWDKLPLALRADAEMQTFLLCDKHDCNDEESSIPALRAFCYECSLEGVSTSLE